MIVKSEFVPHSSDYYCYQSQNQVKNYGSVTVEQLVLKNTSLEGRQLLVGSDSKDDGERNEYGDHSNNLKDGAGDDGLNYLTDLNKDFHHDEQKIPARSFGTSSTQSLFLSLSLSYLCPHFDWP